jgi:hypothetical protein
LILFAKGSAEGQLSVDEIREGLYVALEKLGPKKKVIAIPPDFTRFHSMAGFLLSFL